MEGEAKKETEGDDPVMKTSGAVMAGVARVQLEGSAITTIEGLSTPDALHVLQQSFREHHGLQCGYCTPGMIMRAHRLLLENPAEAQRIGDNGSRLLQENRGATERTLEVIGRQIA